VPQKSPSEESPSIALPQTLTKRARILLAEDDAEVRAALEDLLRLVGYDVYTVENGGELLDYLASWILDDTEEAPADVIVTDIRMPGFSGLSILEGLRARGWRVPVMVMSAFGDDEVRERVRRLGAAVFVAKPFDPEDVERAVEQLVECAEAP
jgi:CheY-like chemotaxis protein